ncbi:inner centromere protein [Biomphalaria glabrata]|uniref:Inner centromere protein ARK-binding domain-containing protein n=1 Tax=Biomphalaria glabrata TaxID=6526 RepID=A0A2C9KY72_BIOGL|nr:inner centromere protein-like [Biomphalaria glabrata]
MENAWRTNFHLACSSLLIPLEECQKAVDKAFADIELDFTWLEEIKNEAYMLFSKKRNKLEIMPKTPSQKLPRQRKTKRKLSELNEDKENELNISNCVPTKLKFEGCSPNEDRLASEETEVKNGRPARNCKANRPNYSEEDDDKPKRGVRQSRRQLNKSQAVKKTEISPSVKDRTKAYEDLIKKSATKSPVPTSLTRNVACHDMMTPTSTKESAVSRQASTLPAQASEVKVKNGAPKDKPDLKITKQGETVQVNSKVNVECQLRMTEKDNLEQQGSSLDETQVMVTEVFEIEAHTKAVKLKEFEMVKSKTTSIIEVSLGSKTDIQQIVSGEIDKVSDQQSRPKSDQRKKQQSDQKKSHNDLKKNKPQVSELDVTQVVVTEVFEIENEKPALLKGSEMVKIKTIPLGTTDELQDSNKNIDNSTNETDKSLPCTTNVDTIFIKPNDVGKAGTAATSKSKNESASTKTDEEIEVGRSTRTRTRAMQQKQMEKSVKDQEDTTEASAAESQSNLNATFTKEDEGSMARTTRTKTRLKKEQENKEIETETEGARTRTRTAKLAVTTVSAASETVQPNLEDKYRCGLKRPVEERGLSPCPKRTRSYQLEKPIEVPNSPSRIEAINKDVLKSPRRSPKAFKFNSAQKKISGFTNRTPGFGMNTSRLFTFVKSTPQSSGQIHSFLKRNSPSPVLTMQVIQEQKKKRMLEKETRDIERMKKAAEMKKRKIEEMKRIREEKERKVAEMKERKLREEQEMKERLNKKLEEQSAMNEKMMEAKLREEREKQRLRLKKQLEADARRKQEEEERLRKLAEQEKERLKQQEEEKKYLAQVEAQKLEMQKLINKHNHTLKTNVSSSSLVTQTAAQDKSLNSYDLTPVKDKQVNVANKDPESYDIEDMGSDESTDDDEAPKKQIPKWATGIDLNVALIRQHANPPDLFALFRHCCLEPPDLEKVFNGTKKRRYKERTSSAIWN